MEKQIYNPRYQAGDAIIQNLRSNRLRRSYASYAPVYEGVVKPIENERIDDPVVYDESGDAVSQNSGGFLQNVGEFLFGDYHHASDRFAEASLVDSWRLFHEKRLQAETTNKLNMVSEAQEKLNELKAAEDYADLVDTYTQLKKEYAAAIKTKNPELIRGIEQKLHKCIEDIVSFQTNIKFDGKQSDINIDLFFDPNKSDNLPTPAKNNIAKNVLSNNVLWNSRETGLSAMMSWVQNLFEGAAMAVDKIFYPNSSKNNFTKKAIKQSLPLDRWTDYLFEGYDNENGPSTAVLRNKIQPYKNYWQKELEDRKISAIESSIQYKNGNWLFDPQKINPKFRYYSEHNDSGLLGALLPDQLLYSFSELGSSWSDWENMALMTMSDVAAGYGAKALSTIAVKRNPCINALLVVEKYNKLRAAGKLDEARKIANAAQQAYKTINNTTNATLAIDALGKTAATTASTYFINRMRQHETNSEIIDAWSNRVTQNSMSKDADMGKVLNSTRQYLTEIGIPTENMTDLDLVQHAIAYNIPTGDLVFEEEKNEARKGLNKVYNENMALAVKDYVEAIPFLSFQGSVLKSFGNKAVPQFGNDAYNNFARGIINNTVERNSNKIFPKDIFSKLSRKHVSDFLLKRLKQVGWVGTLEGIEEGQQHLLQQRYGRGEYDNYNTPKSLLPLSSVTEDLRLASESVTAYLNMLYGDPDNGSPELRRAMQIGAVAGILGGGVGFGLASNILPSDNRDNVRNLIGQLKTDYVVGKIVGDSYGAAQDTVHMNMFYDALQKYGVTRQRLQQSLEELKQFKGENVTDEYIDRDIELMNDVFYYSNNGIFDNNLKEKGIKKDSERYKTEVINAARRRSQVREQYRNIQNQLRELEQEKLATIRRIYDSSNGLSEGQDPEIDILTEQLYKSYNEYKQERKNRRAELQKAFDDIQSSEVFQEWQLEKAKQDLNDFDSSKELNWHDYLENVIDKMIAYRTLQNAEKLQNDLTSKADVIGVISSELGLGIDLPNIRPYMDALERQKEQLYKQLEDDNVYNQNELRKKLNQARQKGQPILPLIENIAIRLEKKYGKLPNQEEIDNIQRNILLSRTYYDVVKPLSNVYSTGEIDPRIAYQLMSPIQWKSLSKEEQKLFLDQVNEQRAKDGKKPLTAKDAILEFSKRNQEQTKQIKDLQDQYVKHMHNRSDEDDSGSVDIDAQQMRREAAAILIDFEYNKFEDLRRINHREYLRDSSSVQVESSAKEGDEDAKTVLQEQVQSYSQDETQQDKDGGYAQEDVVQQESGQTDAAQPTTDGQDDSKPVVTHQSDEGENPVIDSDGKLIIEAPSDESGPQAIEAPSDESEGRQIMTAQEKSLRERLGLDDEDTPVTYNTSQEDQQEFVYDSQEDTSSEDHDMDESQIIQPSIDEQNALIEIDASGESRYDDFLQSRNERTVQSSDQIYSEYLHQTFKYKNTAEDDDLVQIKNIRIVRDAQGNPILKDGQIQYKEEPIKFKNNGVLRSGGQLAKKLLIPGWFENADKYFLISADESSVKDIKNPDNLVVMLAIQDGQDVYLTFLTGLETKINRNGGILTEGEEDIKNRMKSMYYSSFYTEDSEGNRTEHIVKDEYGNIDLEEIKIARFIIIKNQYRSAHLGKDLSNISEQQLWEDAVKWYNSLDKEARASIDLQLRRFISGGRPVYADEKIEEEIQKLRETRNQIIDACLNKDAAGNYIIYSDPSKYKTVVPLNPRTSGGKINDRKENGRFVFRKLTEGGFGMSTNLEELTQQILHEDVMLGVGLGERSFAYVKGEKAPIAKLDPDSTGNYNAYGYGHSGKIYYIATTVNGDRRAIQLFEKKFRDDLEEIDPVDVEEVFTEDGKIKEGEVPTIAEFILRLVTNRISDDVFSGIPSRFIPQFKQHLINLIVNADKSTWVKTKNELKQQHFAQKQFFFDEETNNLVVALKDGKGKYRHSSFSINDIYSNEEVRKIIIAAISNNLHWNTDRNVMVNMFSSEFLEALRQVFKSDESLTEYKVAGIEDLTFKRQDLFDDDLQLKQVSVVAWMLHTGKLLTSVGDTIFSSPFVYADGAVQGNSAEAAAIDLEHKINTQQQSVSTELGSINNIKSRLNDFNAKRIEGLLYIQDKNTRQNLTEGKNIKDFAILDVDSGTSINEKSNDDITKSLKESVKKYISFLKKEYGEEISEDKILYPEESEYAAVQNGQALFTATMNKKKKVIVSVDSIDTIEQMSSEDQIPVSGVFSTVKSDGTLDIDIARQWIQQTLGLSKSQVIITNAVLRALDGKEVFGVTNVAVDTLNDMIKGVILLRKDAGAGIHYHEAFHYVNLLLHTKEQRTAIYEEYLRLHPESTGMKNKEIEERLAEEFRQYCEDIDAWNEKQKNRNVVSRWIHKIIRRFIDFVNNWQKKELIAKLYKNIHSGAYKGHTIDEYSLNEFIKRYPEGVFNGVRIPGKQNPIDFDTIQDARTFFDVAENVAHSFLDFANIKKVGDISGINKSTFEKFFEKLERDNERADNPFIQDVIDNPDAFIDTINSLLMRYGIVRKNNTAHGNKQVIDDDRKERQQPSNEIEQLAELYENYTTSKKDNVAFRAKLFLCQIKDAEFVFDENTQQRILRQRRDPITGLQKYVSYDTAWQIITKELSNVDSYDDILKTVYRLSKTKAFFAQLYKNLQSIRGDVQLETEIFNTVNKHLTKVVQIQMRDKSKAFAKKDRYSDGSEVNTEDYVPAKTIQKTYDQNKDFEILNDNAIKAKRMLPRDWSKDLFGSPLIEFVGGVYQINRTYAKMLQDKLKRIKEAMRMTENLSVSEKQKISQQVFPELLSLIQQMSIPFDDAVLTEYISMHIVKKENQLKESLGGNSKTNSFWQKYNINKETKSSNVDDISTEEFYDAMKQILEDPQASKSSSANISFFINTVFNSKSTNVVKVSKKKMKSINVSGYKSVKNLDEIYEGSAGEIEQMAIAYNNIYPSSRELSITGPGGNLIFPVGENNFMSDIIRWINKNHDNIIQKMQSTPYAKNSNVLEIARILTDSGKLGKTFEFKLNVFAGMGDDQSTKGVDYFGVNSLEDVIAKMMLMNRSIVGGQNRGSDMIILPTMADKKTYYALELVSKNDESYDSFNMPHDLLVSENVDDADQLFLNSTEYTGVRRFSDATLDRFVQYFYDELESLDQYYKRENIKEVVKNKQIRKKNFHGKVKNGKMDFSGNGGHFRYFYGLNYPLQYGEDIVDLNLNQVLEWEYMREQNAGDPLYGDGNWRYRTDDQELDGFEGIRERLKYIRDYFSDKKVLRDAINKMLFDRIDEQLQKFSEEGPSQMIKLNRYSDPLNPQAPVEVHYGNRAIPTQLIESYIQKFKKAGRWSGENGSKNVYASSSYGNSKEAEDIILTVVGNFTVQSMISVIEIEKIFSGDPAFYKWKYSKKRERKVVGDFAYDFEVLLEKDTDKIKRLGALLSPGSELRTDFSTEDYKKYPWLKGTKYINATVSDVKAKSIYLDEIKDIFTRQMVADILRSQANGLNKTKNITGENISSKGSELGKLLTNYGNNIKVVFRGKEFRNAEHAYQTWKSGEFDQVAYNSKAEKPRGSKKVNTAVSDQIMEEILTAKLNQHPELVSAIYEKGGRQYLQLSQHKVVGDKHWESSGDNAFMKALLKAFDNYEINNGTKESVEDAVMQDKNDEEFLNRINKIYTDDDQFKLELNNLTEGQREYVKLSVEQQMKPYGDITVSDAQVLIRPNLYRKIRMMLGQWSVIPVKIKYKDYKGDTHETLYSDDEAYNIIENDPNWMIDAEKAAKVSRLQLFPLKMTYFKNDPRELNPENTIAYGLYNKMAIFPAFKFLFRSKTGKQIYERMNRESDPLDMITFESAVKVGLNQNIYSPYKDSVTDLSELNSELNEPSGCVLDENDNESWLKTGKGLVTEVQDLKGLRMQLNTEAHTDEERAIGTQMFKILFGNIYDDEDYVLNKEGRNSRKGKEIRDDIMACIKALTAIGAHEIKERFYNEDMTTINNEAVLKYLQHVIENNNISQTVTDILLSGGTIESLMQRTLFEHSVSSLVNSHVIDIDTKGGSAIQQSVFGFVSYGADNVRTQPSIGTDIVLNDGRELRWNEEGGSMEVMLSMNFFKAVVPKKYQTSYLQMRQWLINHDIIKGFKTAVNPLFEKLDLSIDDQNVDLSVTTSAVFDELHIKTLGDIIRHKAEISNRLDSIGERNLGKEIEDVLKTAGLSLDTEIPEEKYIITGESKPKPFGVGYRIPTQGMSSTFAFTVADVLPEWVGDTIIVPREFTAQTGSDYDVDKLFLATMSYKNGVLEQVTDGNLLSQSKGAIANRLLQNYIDVVSDVKNRANARASIDVVTNIIQDSTLPAIRGKKTQYANSMYELTPYFQLQRKQEFSIGKSGIGPFALNITNLSLTQYTHISINFKDLPFKLGALDEVVGEDGIRISDWLSAMVNAHVDVAKDPYVFDLNINSATYKFVNLLLRAGKGESTFLFLAQPALKEYAQQFNNANGLYGNNLAYETKEKVPTYRILGNLIEKYKTLLREKISELTDEDQKKRYTKKYNDLLKDENVNWNTIFDKSAAKKALKEQGSIYSLFFQLMSLMSLDMLDDYAQELSDLVTVSRIDTKKFGNTIALQRDFVNEYNRFKYGSRNVSWYNTDGKQIDPRERYFQETFLEDKLFTAVGLTKDILSSQSVTSSKLFGDIMSTIFIDIFGQSEEIKDSTGSKLNIYDKIYDKDVVQQVSNAVENAMRHRLLQHFSNDVNKLVFKRPDNIDDDTKNWKQIEKDNKYTGPIDFLFGGDEQMLLQQLKRLWQGDPQSDDVYERFSIFKNIANIINLLETSSYEDRLGKYKDFVTDKGVVKNELLNFLRAQPANSKFSIPRLLLKKTNRNTFTDEKNRLISAFNDLLTSDLELFRRFGRDLALYAYYSTYNMNAANSFFDLVPKEFREQYDKSLAEGVNNQNGTAIFGIQEQEDIDYGVECYSLLQSICRNFYTNDNIVPLYEYSDKYKGKTILSRGEIIKNIPGTKVPMYLLTSEQRKPFIKMNVNGEIVLYKKKMHMWAEANTGSQRGSHWYLYIPISKLGVHQGTTHQYELYASSADKSIFEDNEISEKWSWDAVARDTWNFIKDSQQKVDKELLSRKKEVTVTSIKVKYEITDKLEVQESKEESVHKNIDNEIKSSKKISVKNVAQFIKDNTNEVIDFSKDSFESDIESLTENNNYSAEKDGISIGITGSLNVDSSNFGTEINKILMQMQNQTLNISDMYVEDTEFGRTFADVYKQSGFSFAENVIIVSEKVKSNPDVVEDNNVVENSSSQDNELESIQKGAEQMDQYLDKTDKFIDEPISTGNFWELQKKALEYMKKLKESKGSIITSESEKKENNDGSFSNRC